jgi:hypothetical protein
MQYPFPVRPIVLGCYLISLFQGNGLRSSPIRSDTAKGYLRAAVSWNESPRAPDPRYRPQQGLLRANSPLILAHPLKSILEMRRSWESLPNRREPFTQAMLEHLTHATLAAHTDSLDSTLRDWYAVGINAGCRRSEWAQEASKPIKLSPDGECPLAFTRNDVLFLDANFRAIKLQQVASGRLLPNFVRLRWRFQKNHDNGETKTFATIRGGPSCIVTAMIRIIQRSFRLRLSDTYPLAVFGTSSVVTLINDSHITTSLRQLAVAVYGPMSTADLQRFSSHSLRVGACVLLHAAGKDEVFIKQRLRWRSNSFMNYLRDVPILALEHAAILRRSQLGHIAPTLLDKLKQSDIELFFS